MYILVMVDGERRRITLNGAAENKKQGETICRRVELLSASHHSKQPIDTEAAVWVAGISDKLYQSIAKAGLLPPRESRASVESRPTLGQLVQLFSNAKGKLESSSATRLAYETDRLKDRFGSDKPIESFTAGCATEYEGWLAKQGLSEGSQRTAIRYAKQLFSFAVDKEWLTRNPFQKLKASSLPATREHYVSPAQSHAILQAIDRFYCHDRPLATQWRVLFGLARYAGLRVPSEAFKIRWDQVNWEMKALTVPCKKTRRYSLTRPAPIIPELMPLLRDAHAIAGDRELIVGLSPHNRARTFPEILEAAGIPVWDDLFQTLRRSCETHLVSLGYEAHAVAQWLGHSERVSKGHYLMVTAEVFKRATETRTPVVDRK